MPQERRKHVRTPSYLGGRVAFNHLYATADCLIRNISPVGARLIFAAPTVLPDRFVISIPTREQTLNARIAWRTERDAGVVFEVPTPLNVPVSLDIVRKMKRLEDDKKRLQLRIDELSREA